MIISAIAAMSQNRTIGRGNALPWHIPMDLKRFREITRGKVVIMGRKTFDSIGGKPLPGRPHVVITRDKTWRPPALAEGAPSVDVVHSVHEAVARAHELVLPREQTGENPEVFILGGAEIYRETVPLWDRIYLTVVEAEVAGDAFFPDFAGGGFKLAQTERAEEGDWSFRFEDWVRA